MELGWRFEIDIGFVKSYFFQEGRRKKKKEGNY